MSKLEELIEKLCPDGVEYVPLWSVTIWDKKFNSVDRKKQPSSINYKYLLAADLFALEAENGSVFLLSTGEQTGWTTEELAGDNLYEGEVVTIPWGKSRAVTDCIKYYKGKFVTADNRIMTSNDVGKLNNKYLYYWVMTQGKIIDTFYRGSGIKHPDMSKVLDLQIPIPPLPVQEEIVRILDNFTSLTAELEAELEARKKQYEYYRDYLLTFGENVPRVKLNSVSNCSRGKRVVKTELVDNGKYAVYQNSLAPMGYYDKANRKANMTYVITAGAAGEIGFSSKEFWSADDCLTIECNENFIDKYVYYYLMVKQEQIKTRVRKASIPRLDRSVIENMPIPVITIEEQQRIVSILDRFDKLCNDITEGLPAEIEARQKQYEYYRDKLLTFKIKE